MSHKTTPFNIDRSMQVSFYTSIAKGTFPGLKIDQNAVASLQNILVSSVVTCMHKMMLLRNFLLNRQDGRTNDYTDFCEPTEEDFLESDYVDMFTLYYSMMKLYQKSTFENKTLEREITHSNHASILGFLFHQTLNDIPQSSYQKLIPDAPPLPQTPLEYADAIKLHHDNEVEMFENITQINERDRTGIGDRLTQKFYRLIKEDYPRYTTNQCAIVIGYTLAQMGLMDDEEKYDLEKKSNYTDYLRYNVIKRLKKNK